MTFKIGFEITENRFIHRSSIFIFRFVIFDILPNVLVTDFHWSLLNLFLRKQSKFIVSLSEVPKSTYQMQTN